MRNEKKNFFKRPSAAEILRNTNNREITRDYWEHISELKEGESITLIGKIFPYNFTDSREFLKNGPIITIPTKDKENPLLLPFEIREKTFNSLPKHRLRYAGFKFTPHSGEDRTPRLIRLNDIAEATKLHAYAPLLEEPEFFKSFVEIAEVYDSGKGVGEIGASFVVKVPSRTKGKGKYTIRVDGIPVENNKEKYNIAYTLKTDHVCEDKRHYLRFPTKKSPRPSPEYFIDAHELHAYISIIAYLVKNAREKEKETGIARKIIPMEMILTGAPTELLCKTYDNMLNRVLIKPAANSDPLTPKEGHLEALLWEGMIKEGYRKLFFNNTGEKLKDFPWTKYSK